MAKQAKEEKKDIEARIAELDKKYGKTSIKEKKVVLSGSYMIDIATGIGGYPLGKVIELYGPESSGKSTITLEAIASFQKTIKEKRVAYIDFEYSFDPDYAISLGVNLDELIIYQPDSQEDGYDYIIDLIEKEICSLVIIDSYTAAIPQKVIELGMSDATIGIAARNNSKFLGKIKGLLSRKDALLIGVSQLRTNIGGMGDTNIPTGGQSWKFYADMRFKIWKTLDKDSELNRTTVDVVKNKCSKPFGKAEFDIVWGHGIDNLQEIIDLAESNGVITRAGSWYSYGDIKLGQGANGVKSTFDDNRELFEEIKNKALNGTEQAGSSTTI